MEKLSRSMTGCRSHTRYEKIKVTLYGKVSVDLLIPCCQYPVSETLIFQEKQFHENGRFSLPAYETALTRFCHNHCPSYHPGTAPIEYIVAGSWKKCPLKCVTCYNHYENSSNEHVLSDKEMEDYLFALAELYAEAARHNAEIGAPPPLLQIGGAGDIFYSENYSRMLFMDLRKYGLDRIHLITNMQAWTPKNMQVLSPATRMCLRKITFSVDSINPGLYEKIRRGASWKRLLYSYAICTGAFPNIEYDISYTVSCLNFHEYKKAPVILKELFPKINSVTMNIARDWANTPESALLVLPENLRAEVENWCASRPEDGIKVAYHGPLK